MCQLCRPIDLLFGFDDETTELIHDTLVRLHEATEPNTAYYKLIFEFQRLVSLSEIASPKYILRELKQLIEEEMVVVRIRVGGCTVEIGTKLEVAPEQIEAVKPKLAEVRERIARTDIRRGKMKAAEESGGNIEVTAAKPIPRSVPVISKSLFEQAREKDAKASRAVDMAFLELGGGFSVSNTPASIQEAEVLRYQTPRVVGREKGNFASGVFPPHRRRPLPPLPIRIHHPDPLRSNQIQHPPFAIPARKGSIGKVPVENWRMRVPGFEKKALRSSPPTRNAETQFNVAAETNRNTSSKRSVEALGVAGQPSKIRIIYHSLKQKITNRAKVEKRDVGTRDCSDDRISFASNVAVVDGESD